MQIQNYLKKHRFETIKHKLSRKIRYQWTIRHHILDEKESSKLKALVSMGQKHKID